MLEYLVTACVAAREDAGSAQKRIAALMGLNQSSVHRFESGNAWPRDPDAYVAAYATVSGVGPAAIWRDALERYLKAEPKAESPDGLPAELVAIESALAAAAAKRRKRD